eukprot:CAMPEP_0197262522 /NCGR_PEP_ID=MMETSP1432-20130617/542_1 /TAXON_ID=44447 /ORGANISM="Pseudo-nitzschia delicatissima, Strain UNC1205" /LENGTH=143 /DNA_ID=CAMNT_0042726823 /DNA_START=120 /DNA_END=551 /DNA_ORIENTATION=-
MSILLLILCFDPIGGNPPKFWLNLMIGIGGTGLLARDTKDRIHVVVTHVRSLGSNVLRAEGAGKSLLVHEWNIAEGRNGGDRREDDSGGASLAELGDQRRGSGALNVVTTTIEMRSRTTGRGLVPNFYHFDLVVVSVTIETDD